MSVSHPLCGTTNGARMVSVSTAGRASNRSSIFHSKEIVAISCSWYKQAYHNKVSCFMLQHMGEPCSLGEQTTRVPPHTHTWMP